jgi:hypothetical protein
VSRGGVGQERERSQLSNVECVSSDALYRKFVARGYRPVRRYSGGLLDCEDAGLPLEGRFVNTLKASFVLKKRVWWATLDSNQ